MRERPVGVTDADVLAAVRRGWDEGIARVDHLPLGFGAYHWAAHHEQGPRLFVTLDPLEPRHTAASLEAAYGGALALREAGIEFALAPLRTRDGPLATAFPGGALSCTPWRDGSSGGALDVTWTRAALGHLHAATPPPGLPRWRPLVGPQLSDEVADLAHENWGPGPHAEAARGAVRCHLDDLDRWTARYHHLARAAAERPWVATHGEPGSANQLLTADGRLLVDWESLKLAPPEIDLRTLVAAGAEVAADPEMLELFDLEWRLDEINQYVARFAAPHTGTTDDHIAFGGLLEELSRPSQATSSG